MTTDGTNKRLVIGVGTGRCGSRSLAQLLDAQVGARVTHESRPLLPWDTRNAPQSISQRFGRIAAASSGANLIGDVAFFYLNYIDEIVASFPDVRIICLQRDRGETVESYVRWLAKQYPGLNVDHWSSDRIGRAANAWDDCYPTFACKSLRDGIGRYWDLYDERVSRILEQYGPIVRRYETTALLNDERAITDMLDWLGVAPEAQVHQVIRANANPERRGSQPAHASVDLKEHFSVAMKLHQAGRVAEAKEVYEAILLSTPDHPGSHHLYALALLQESKPTPALSHIEKALSLCDTKAVYWNTYGAVLRALGRLDEARSAFEHALSIRADYPDAISNLGLILCDMGQLEEAERHLREALRLSPEHADALAHQGDVYRERGEWDEAERCYRTSLTHRAGHAGTLRRLAGVLRHQQRWNEAVTTLQAAAEAAPNDAETHQRLGAIFSEMDQVEEAKASISHAAGLKPDRPMWRFKHLSLCPAVFERSEEVDAHWESLHQGLDAAIEASPRMELGFAGTDGFTPPFALAHHGRSRRPILEKYARLFRSSIPFLRPARRERNGRIRVGFLVTEGHEGGFLRGTKGIIQQLNKARFEPVLLTSASIVRKCHKAIGRADMGALGFPSSYAHAVKKIQATDCDVICHWQVDTDTMNYLLPMSPLAPIQCTGWGTHGTSGLDSLDYYLSSRLCERGPEAAEDYTETLVRAETFLTWQARPKAPREATRAEFGLPETGAVYFCPHRAQKFHPDFDAFLRRILEQDPKGTLVLLEGRCSVATAKLRDRMTRTLGANLMTRVRFLPMLKPPEYYGLMSLATVCLDPPTYSSGLVGYDACAIGTPIVTLPGPLMVQRYTLGLYTKMGLNEHPCIVNSEEAYVETAVRVGTDADFRETLRREILDRSDVLFEDVAAVREFESFLIRAAQDCPPSSVSMDEDEREIETLLV